MKKTSFFIGLNDKDSKRQEITSVEAFKIVENTFNVFCQYGATIHECRGIYKHENGDRVIENTLEAFTTEELTQETIEAIVTTLKTALNQESIMIMEENVNTMFL